MRRDGAPVRTRTGNQLIKSQLLYQLSYRGNQKNGSILTHDRALSKTELECCLGRVGPMLIQMENLHELKRGFSLCLGSELLNVSAHG